MKRKKELVLNEKIFKHLRGKSIEAAKQILEDEELHELQEYANLVSIRRLGYNDHGPVHMRTVALNALKLASLLKKENIQLNLEKEGLADYEDSQTVLLFAGILHDIGMTVARDHHELMSVHLAIPILDRILPRIYPNTQKRIILRSMILEGILGHMATNQIHSIEAGLILIGDGLDMEKGRARIPMLLNTSPMVGDIHKYSAAAIEKVKILSGKKKAIRIEILMSSSVGFFQIEEVLFRKINASPVKPYIELCAGVIGKELKHYL